MGQGWVRGVVGAALAVIVGCAHAGTRSADARAERAAVEVPAPSPAESAAESATGSAPDLGAWAGRFGNALACEREARRASPSSRFASIRACVRREDFTDAAVLLRPPWSELLRAQGLEGVDVLARVLARRGFDWAVDVDVAVDLGLPIGALDPRSRAPGPTSATRRGWTLVRARLVRRRGSPLMLVGETAVLREHKQARIQHTYGVLGYVHAPEVKGGDRALAGFHEWGPSGTELQVTRGSDRCGEPEGAPVLALVRLTRLAPIAPVHVDDTTKGQFEGEAELVRCYPAAQHG